MRDGDGHADPGADPRLAVGSSSASAPVAARVTSAVTVRPASLGDLDRLVALHAVVHAAHVQAEPTVFRPASGRAAAEVLTGWLAADDVLVLVADHPAAGVVGYAVALDLRRPGSDLVRSSRVLHVDEIAVDAAHRRQGVAAALLAAVDEAAARRRADGVELSVWTFNGEALAAFTALGFAPAHQTLRRRPGQAGEGSEGSTPRSARD